MEKSYRIQNVGLPDYCTGNTADGNQVLIGLLCPDLVAVFFDSTGTFLRVERRPWSYPAPRTSPGAPYKLSDPQFRRNLERDVQAWQQEIGFEPQTISVQRFFSDEHYIGIEDFPEYLSEFKKDTKGFTKSAEEEASLHEILDTWEANGKFVLWWGKDYYLDGEGDVDST